MKLVSSLVLLFCMTTLSLAANNVTYDNRSLLIDGQRKLIISAAIHYPRSVPEMWPGLVQTAKEGGVDAIETYVFWNGHEFSPGHFNFDGRWNLVKFAKIVQQSGLYLILRIGPFVASEWNFGGIPPWLHYIPGAVFRTDNEPFKHYMERFVTHIVKMMTHEKLFASQGGPIILSQVENEYGMYEADYGNAGRLYASWAANMAVAQKTGVPWIMCKQWDAPVSVINTCNDFYCEGFNPRHPNMPKIWTENWTGWFETFGSTQPHRPVEDIAYSVARFFQKGGSLMNYYMYHGGTNFGRTSGGPFITTSYDYDAPIDEYGLPNLPKWGHLKELHRAIKLCENALLNNVPNTFDLGPLQQVDVYGYGSKTCAAFIANMDEKDGATVYFGNQSIHLPAWSVSILPDCKNVVFNTAKVGWQSSVVKMLPADLKSSMASPRKDLSVFKWGVFTEKVGVWADADVISNGLVDHIDTTKDSTDYLWYTTSFHVDDNEEFLRNGSKPTLLIESKGHALHVFVNQVFHGSASSNDPVLPFKTEISIPLKTGKNEIAILSMTVGLQTAGEFYEWKGAGLTSVKVKGFNNGTVDLSTSEWTYKIGLEGEHLNIYKKDGLNNVNWESTREVPRNQPLTWYKAVVDAPPGNEPVGLDMVSMGKGLAWLNGEEMGRYWNRKSSTNDTCVQECDYRGKFYGTKCSTGCGEPTQRWYHAPRSWFKPSGNILIIFEETGGDPSKIRFARRTHTSICARLSEDQPTFNHKRKSIVQLKCPTGTRISGIKFASFGTPNGTCGSFSIGDCHDPNTISFVKKVCLNKSNCSIQLPYNNFNKNLCPGDIKTLAVEAICSSI